MNMNEQTKRALIQFAESMTITAIIAGIVTITPLIEAQGPMDWKQAGIAFGLASLFSVAHSVVAYIKPSQPLLSAAAEGLVDAAEKRYQPSTPLQGSTQGQIQGPLVVVNHPAVAMPSGVPQNNATMTVGAANLMSYPNISQPTETNPAAFEDTAPRPIIKPS